MNKREVTLPELLNMLREVVLLRKRSQFSTLVRPERKGKQKGPLRRERARAGADRVKQSLLKRTRQRTKTSASTTAKMGIRRETTKSILQRVQNRSLEKLQVYSWSISICHTLMITHRYWIPVVLIIYAICCRFWKGLEDWREVRWTSRWAIEQKLLQ